MFVIQNQRESARKERYIAEFYRTLRRFDYECSDVISYKLSPEELASDNLNETIRRKYESKSYCVQPKGEPFRR